MCNRTVSLFGAIYSQIYLERLCQLYSGIPPIKVISVAVNMEMLFTENYLTCAIKIIKVETPPGNPSPVSAYTRSFRTVVGNNPRFISVVHMEKAGAKLMSAVFSFHINETNLVMTTSRTYDKIS